MDVLLDQGPAALPICLFLGLVNDSLFTKSCFMCLFLSKLISVVCLLPMLVSSLFCDGIVGGHILTTIQMTFLQNACN